MSAQIMQSELLVELSEEQQQLVTGGTSIQELKDTLATYYKTDTSVLDLSVNQFSGPGGSYNQQKFSAASLNIDTAAFKKLLAKV